MKADGKISAGQDPSRRDAAGAGPYHGQRGVQAPVAQVSFGEGGSRVAVAAAPGAGPCARSDAIEAIWAGAAEVLTSRRTRLSISLPSGQSVTRHEHAASLIASMARTVILGLPPTTSSTSRPPETGAMETLSRVTGSDD